ncbi:response regulator [Clostridium magnum]|uniref:Stage 0 sporulation protein A homolog n=1 Tax=Clostridium magnum DSM 2767 TaxID=1121326 RepID=A0A162SVP8_9CLOT|nr:response regulator [Clostridium magnum]KZL91923.1 transcriptional regulatory protein ZraR [Clostridium magnum DSM 2767]SHH29699.1 Tetratricopeptide repeat-containing protein [Clostridium magnum DSM 2767]
MKKALVVDDTKNIRALLTTCLEINDYKVTTAKSGQEAIDLLKIEEFDLVFLDIRMPEISGTTVLRKIREMSINIPVITMTAYATVKNAIECTKLGVVAYLQKPFTAEKVKSVLDEIFSNDDRVDDLGESLKQSRELIKDEKNEEAYEILKKALSINPSCSEVYYLIGMVHEKNGDVKQAEKFYETAERFEIDESET